MAVVIEERSKLAGATEEKKASTSTPSYGVNYNDQRFGQVESDKQQALTELENTYGGMVEDTDKYYQAQIDATKAWEQKQAQLQQERTDFAIEQIEQQKDQTTKDYKKEQSGAYVDWQKQSNQYGANAEQMASAGMMNSGYAESSQVSMYNTYQNRVATARESYNLAILNYNNAIKDARLQNNAALAEIAYKSLQQQLELSLNGFQYKNQLIDNLYNKKTELDNTYYNRYQDVLSQINHENALREEIRQYEQNYAFQQDKYKTEQAQWQKEYDNKNAQWQKEYALQQAKLKEEQRQFDAQMAEEQRQYNASLAAANAKANASAIKKSSSSSGGSSSGSEKKVRSANAKVYEVVTAYYRGDKNADVAKFGAFENGYQPKGISGHGKLAKTGQTIELNTQTLYGQKQVLIQNVWKAQDGTKWYWDGRENAYLQI